MHSNSWHGNTCEASQINTYLNMEVAATYAAWRHGQFVRQEIGYELSCLAEN